MQPSLRCDFDTGKKVARREVSLRIFTLYRREPRPLSELLARCAGDDDAVTNLQVLRRIYLAQGSLTPPPSAAVPDKPALLEPVLVAPQWPYTKLYPMLGASAAALQRVVREFEPDFDVEQCMRRVAADYSVPLDDSFPLEGQEEEDRVVPVFVLPQLLTLLPRCYQDASNTLFELEHLQLRLPVVLSGEYTPEVAQQVQWLGQNRRYLAFLYQAAFHAHAGGPLCDEERHFYEADLVAITEAARKEAEAAQRASREVRRQLAQLCDEAETPRKKKRRRRCAS